VLAFKGPTKVENQFAPDVALIAMCEQLLVDAKSGKLRGLGVAMVTHDDLISSGFVEQKFTAAPGTAHALGESISRLRRRWDNQRDAESV
jgi:hypothetical protein